MTDHDIIALYFKRDETAIIVYATGERNIEGNYIMLKVVDKENDIEYYPVFSPTTVASMNPNQRIKIPKHSNEVKPLYGKFKYIYNLLEARPFMHVRSFAVKDVNDAIRNYLQKDVNRDNENFHNLREYIEYLHNNANGKRVRNVDFESLRVILRNDYPNEVIYI